MSSDGRLMCILDGATPFSRNKMVDIGQLTRELAANIGAVHSEKKHESLQDLLAEARDRTQAGGKSHCVMAELSDEIDVNEQVTMRTLAKGNPSYLLLRPGSGA